MKKVENLTCKAKNKHMIRNVSQEFLRSCEISKNLLKVISTPGSKPPNYKKRRNQSMNSHVKPIKNLSNKEVESGQNLLNDESNEIFLNSTLNNTVYIEKKVPEVLNEIQQSIMILRKFYQDLSSKRKCNSIEPEKSLNIKLTSIDRDDSPGRLKVDIDILQKEYEKCYHSKTKDIRVLYDFYVNEYLNKSKSTALSKTLDKTHLNSSIGTCHTSHQTKNDNRILHTPLSSCAPDHIDYPMTPVNTRRMSPSRSSEEIERELTKNASRGKRVLKTQADEVKQLSKERKPNELSKSCTVDVSDCNKNNTMKNEKIGALMAQTTKNKNNLNRSPSKRKSMNFGNEFIRPQDFNKTMEYKRTEEAKEDKRKTMKYFFPQEEKRAPSSSVKRSKSSKKSQSISIPAKKSNGSSERTMTSEIRNIGDRSHEDNGKETEEKAILFSKIFAKNMLINQLKQNINENLQTLKSKREDIPIKNVQEVKQTLNQLQMAQTQKLRPENHEQLEQPSFGNEEEKNFQQKKHLKARSAYSSQNMIKDSSKTNKRESKEKKPPNLQQEEIFLNSYDLKVLDNLSKMADIISEGAFAPLETSDKPLQPFHTLSKTLNTDDNFKKNKYYVQEVPEKKSETQTNRINIKNNTHQFTVGNQTISELESILDNSTSLVAPNKANDTNWELLNLVQRQYLDTCIDEGEFFNYLQSYDHETKVLDSANYSQELEASQYQITFGQNNIGNGARVGRDVCRNQAKK